MRWLTFFILAYVAVGLQIGLSAHLRLGACQPNFPLLVVVFVAVNAPRETGLLACFICGAMLDLVTADSMGLNALSFGLFGLVAAGSAQSVQRGHPLTHAAMTMLGGSIIAIVIYIHAVIPWFRNVPLGYFAVSPGFFALLGSALYSALLAPMLLFTLNQLRDLFAFQAVRRRMR